MFNLVMDFRPLNLVNWAFIAVFAVIYPCLAGGVLWQPAPRLAGWAAMESGDRKLAVAVDAASLLNVCLIAIGIVLQIQVLPAMVDMNFTFLVYRQPGGFFQTTSFVSESMRAVLGVLLVLTAKPFTRLVYRLRQQSQVGHRRPLRNKSRQCSMQQTVLVQTIRRYW